MLEVEYERYAPQLSYELSNTFRNRHHQIIDRLQPYFDVLRVTRVRLVTAGGDPSAGEDGASGRALNLTAEHRLPTGPRCCSTLQKAKDVAAGDTVWVVESGATVARRVQAVALVKARGLHSPVLSAGSFPVVDGVVTSFDRIESVTLASYGLSALLGACEATGTCGGLKRAHAWISGRATADYIV